MRVTVSIARGSRGGGAAAHLRQREIEAPLPILAVEVDLEVVASFLGPFDHHELAIRVAADAVMHPRAEHREKRDRSAFEEEIGEARTLDVAGEYLTGHVESTEQGAAARAADGVHNVVESPQRAGGGAQEVGELLERDPLRAMLLLELGDADDVLVQASAQRRAEGVHHQPRLE